MVGGKENLWLLGTLKCSIWELILLAWKDMESDRKCFLYILSYYIYFRDSEFGHKDHGARYCFELRKYGWITTTDLLLIGDFLPTPLPFP